MLLSEFRIFAADCPALELFWLIALAVSSYAVAPEVSGVPAILSVCN
jgi:hypothetical protein